MQAMGGDGSYRDKGGLWGDHNGSVCVCLFLLLYPAGYFKHSFLVGHYHVVVSPLCWMVTGSLLSLESSSILPGKDRYMSEWKL